MILTSHHKKETNYWLKVFALYALVETCIQLLFFFILNNFGTQRISILEYHLVMLFFQCLLILPIWWLAWLVRQQTVIIQVAVNLIFYALYSYIWFGPVQDAIAYLYSNLQEITRPVSDRQVPYLDRGNEFSFLSYQLLKHAFRLSWFYLGSYFYNYRLEESKRVALAVSNKDLQLKLLKWHLNPSFYFKTIKHLQQSAAAQPSNATEPILQLAKVMEYVIYEARQQYIEMKKEIQFLTNYIGLINQQPDNKALIKMEFEGEYDKLKIAPFLLAGIIDNIVLSPKEEERSQCFIEIKFTGNEINFSVTGIAIKPITPPLLEELYKHKYFIKYTTEKGFNLNIKLDEA